MTVGGLAALALAVSIASGGRMFADGALYDAALVLRAIPETRVSEAYPDVVVIGVDKRSLDAPVLAQLPRSLFGPVWRRTIDIAVTAGAKTVAFDFLLAFSAGPINREHDKGFLRTLSAERSRIVLGRSAGSVPARPYLGALRMDREALGLMELEPDSDGVFRRVPMSYRLSTGERLPTLVGAALARAGYSVPTNDVLLAPRVRIGAVPAVSIADVLACGETAPERLRERFDGRIVFVGTFLAEEDSKQGPSRFFARPESPRLTGGDCRLAPPDATRPGSRFIPGVLLHAAAAQQAISGPRIEMLPGPIVHGIAAVMAAIGTVLGLALAPALALALGVALAIILFAGEVALIGSAIWFPSGTAILAGPVSVAASYTGRYLAEVRRRRQIQTAFGHYVAPAVVSELMGEERLPELGGERREVTIMFADLSGFTALSERVSAQELMSYTNRFLSQIVNEVERTGGYVDKFIGDAVMAIWGAPLVGPSHANDAVRSALAIARLMVHERKAAIARGEDGFWVKMGINSGEAVIGNIGAINRLSYTAVGETVNLAARFESLPSDYGCLTVIGEGTASALDGNLNVYELDSIIVKGKLAPVRVYEPLEADQASGDYPARYAEALAHYRARRFDEAQRIWVTLDYPGYIDPKRRQQDAGEILTPNLVMGRRALAFLEQPPPEDWQGEWVKASK